ERRNPAHADFQVIAVEIVEVDRALQRRIGGMLDRPAHRAIAGAQLSLDLGKALARDADADPRRRARRRSGLNARQVKADDVFTSEQITLARTAVGIAPRGFELEPERVGVKRLVGFERARGHRDVVDGFDAETDFRNHSCAAPAVRVSSLLRPYKSAARIVNGFGGESQKIFAATRPARGN